MEPEYKEQLDDPQTFPNLKRAGISAKFLSNGKIEQVADMTYQPRNLAYISEFPGCCGITVIHGIPDNLSAVVATALLRDCIGLMSGAHSGRLVLYSVTTYQSAVRKALEAVGFLAGDEFVNGSTGRTVTLYSYTI